MIIGHRGVKFWRSGALRSSVEVYTCIQAIGADEFSSRSELEEHIRAGVEVSVKWWEDGARGNGKACIWQPVSG